MSTGDMLYELKNGKPYRLISYAPAARKEKIEVLDGTQILESYVFVSDETNTNFSSVTELSLPSTLKTIYPYAIGLPNLKVLTIPNGVTEIEDMAIPTFVRLTMLFLTRIVRNCCIIRMAGRMQSIICRIPWRRLQRAA